MKSIREYMSCLPNMFVKYKYVLLVAAVGISLIAWPSGSGETVTAAPTAAEQPADTAHEEARLAALLSQVDGVGRVEVMLSLKSDMEYVYADEHSRSYDETDASTSVEESMSYIKLRESDGSEALVTLTRVYPAYKGAVIVCDGAQSPAARLAIIKAVSAATGLTSDRIAVMKMK